MIIKKMGVEEIHKMLKERESFLSRVYERHKNLNKVIVNHLLSSNNAIELYDNWKEDLRIYVGEQ